MPVFLVIDCSRPPTPADEENHAAHEVLPKLDIWEGTVALQADELVPETESLEVEPCHCALSPATDICHLVPMFHLSPLALIDSCTIQSYALVECLFFILVQQSSAQNIIQMLFDSRGLRSALYKASAKSAKLCQKLAGVFGSASDMSASQDFDLDLVKQEVGKQTHLIARQREAAAKLTDTAVEEESQAATELSELVAACCQHWINLAPPEEGEELEGDMVDDQEEEDEKIESEEAKQLREALSKQVVAGTQQKEEAKKQVEEEERPGDEVVQDEQRLVKEAEEEQKEAASRIQVTYFARSALFIYRKKFWWPRH